MPGARLFTVVTSKLTSLGAVGKAGLGATPTAAGGPADPSADRPGDAPAPAPSTVPERGGQADEHKPAG